MPTATTAPARRTRKPKAAAAPATIEGEAREVEVQNPAGDPPPTPQELEAAGVEFFPMLQKLAPALWEQAIVYLYRVAPKVESLGGTPKFICKYVTPFDEQTVKADHGGGKYKAIFRFEDYQRSCVFEVEGEPKILATQKVVDGTVPAAAAAPTPADSDARLIMLVQTILDKTQNKPQDEAIRIALDTMKAGLSGAMEVVTSAAKQSVNPAPAPGNSIVETLLGKLIAGEAIGPKNPLLDKMLEVMIKRMMNDDDDGGPIAAAPDPIEQLGKLKDAFGLDMQSLIKNGQTAAAQKNAWVESLLNVGLKLVDQLPQLFLQWRQAQHEAFQRAVLARQLQLAPAPATQPGAAAVPTPPPATSPLPSGFAAVPAPTMPEAIPPQTSVTQPGAGAQPAAPGATESLPTPEQAMNLVMTSAIQTIARSYEDGDDGETCAFILMRAFPELVAQLKPQLANPLSVKLVCDSYFASYAGDDEFQPFIDEMVKTILNPPAAEPGETQPA